MPSVSCILTSFFHPPINPLTKHDSGTDWHHIEYFLFVFSCQTHLLSQMPQTLLRVVCLCLCNCQTTSDEEDEAEKDDDEAEKDDVEEKTTKKTKKVEAKPKVGARTHDSKHDQYTVRAWRYLLREKYIMIKGFSLCLFKSCFINKIQHIQRGFELLSLFSIIIHCFGICVFYFGGWLKSL